MKQRIRNCAATAAVLMSAAVLLLLSPALGAQSAPCDRSMPLFEERLLNRINQYREENGLAPLSRHKTLDALARHHSTAMCRENSLSHDGFDRRFRQSGRRRCVENVGWNCATAAEQFTLWRESPGHDRNLLEKGIKSAGICRTGAYVTFFACE